MTRFEKDMREVLNGFEVEVLTKRKAEIERLKKELSFCKNEFRAKCIMQDLIRLKREYKELDSNA